MLIHQNVIDPLVILEHLKASNQSFPIVDRQGHLLTIIPTGSRLYYDMKATLLHKGIGVATEFEFCLPIAPVNDWEGPADDMVVSRVILRPIAVPLQTWRSDGRGTGLHFVWVTEDLPEEFFKGDYVDLRGVFRLV